MCAAVEAECALIIAKQRQEASERSCDAMQPTHTHAEDEQKECATDSTPVVSSSSSSPSLVSSTLTSSISSRSSSTSISSLNLHYSTAAATMEIELEATSSASIVERGVGGPTSTSTPFDWDAYEVRLFADQLQSFAENFMPKPEGKPDDLTIVVAKIKKHHTTQTN
jgi:hypothetical protein